MHSQDEKYIMRCLDIARLGAGKVSPNPLVGSVIVYQDEIIGEGWHQSYGGAHAEVNAIADVRDKSILGKATLYVNLEPCSHYGITPPCSDLIVQHKIPRVVIATLDDNPEVRGNGVRKMEEHGIEVISGICEEEARLLNRYFFTYHNQNRPYVILKWAQAANGFFAPANGQQWISNAASKRLTHKKRHAVDAVIVGRKTAELDHPRLTDRYWNGKPILRVVLDPENSLPKENSLFSDGLPTLLLNNSITEKNGSVEFFSTSEKSISPSEILKELYQRKIQSVLIEGGANTLNRFIKAGLWDECSIYVSDVIEDTDQQWIKAPDLGMPPHAVEDLDNNRIELYYRQ